MALSRSAPLRAIRDMCLQCVCGSAKEVELCPSANCPLHKYRFGNDPDRAAPQLSDEVRAACSERMRQINNR